jgi:SET domain
MCRLTRSSHSRSAFFRSNARSRDDVVAAGTIWIAPSSVRGVNGYGIFTTRNLKAGESILGGPDGVAIPFEPYLHRDVPDRNDRHHFLGLFGEYMWGRGIPDHSTYEADRGYVLDYQIGFGSLPNHHCVLAYLDILYPDPPYVDSLADRFRDPSAGAFSYNRGREFVVTSPLRAGDEIFLNYGYCARSGQSPAWTQHMYVTQDFQDAATLIQQHLRQPASSQLYHAETGQLLVPPETSELVASLLPQSQDAITALYRRYAYSGTALTREVAQQSLNRQTPESIRSTGVCLDNLVARQSTLKVAGQGAFAQRRIRAGKVITPAPFLHVLNKASLDVYGSDGTPNGTQLLLNYCWGHGASTILLCPNTNAVMINHCSARTRECGPHGPNAAYRWASDPVTAEWLALSVEELRHQSGRGLAMEIVALRDIPPGEEVFLDYGVEWEEAWMAHLSRWKPPSRPPGTWISARDANDKQGPILDALVARNLTQTIDHPYLFTGCVYWATDMDFHEVYQQQKLTWQGSMPEDELLGTFSDPGDMFTYPDPARGYGHHPDRMHWPCTVLRQENDAGSRYLVRIHQAPWWSATNQGASLPWHTNKLPRLLRNYPRSSIHYFVHPYTSDQHLPGVFRHELRIRDDLFPTQWKNVAATPR